MSRVAIVADAKCPLGPAICAGLRDQGFLVVSVTSRHPDLEDVAAHHVLERHWDLGRLAECAAGVSAAELDVGPVAVLVNCSAPQAGKPFHHIAAQDWRAVLGGTIGSYFNMVKAAWPGMQGRGFGRVVNVASLEGQMGAPDAVASSAAMAAVRGFTKSLASEGGRCGVTVNTLAVGDIWAGTQDTGSREERARRIPVGRVGEPHDVGRAVAFLCSDEAGYITGSTLSVNGGAHMF